MSAHPSDPEETQAAMGRVSAFLIRWSEMRGISQEYIHSLDGGDYELTTQDLRTLLGALHRIELVDSIRTTNAGLITRNEGLLLLAEGRGDLLACYRTGKQPKESTFKKIEKAERLLGADKP